MIDDPLKKIRFLVQQKFKEHFPIVESANTIAVKKTTPEQKARIEKEIAEYQAELAKTPFPELDRLYKETYAEVQKRAEEAQKRRLEQEELEIKKILADPRWQLRCRYWAMMARWDIEEAIEITAGFDPQIMDETDFPTYFKTYVAKKIREIREPIIRRWKNHYIAPDKFLLWIKQHQIDFPKELEELIMKNANVVDWKTAYDDLKKDYDSLEAQHKGYVSETEESIKKKDKQIRHRSGEINALYARVRELEANKNTSQEKELKSKERISLLKLVLGMAIDGYRYDPQSTRTSIHKEIADCLRTRGISIDEDTVRKWLNEAKEAIEIETDA